MGLKNLDMRTTQSQMKKIIVAGRGVMTLGTGFSTVHVLVSIQLSTHSVPFLPYPSKHV